MAEVVGLVLGGIPIAIWALEKYAETLETYRNYHIVIQTLRTNLILQERQLQITFENIGLDKPTTEDLKACFQSRFPEAADHLLFTIQRMEDITAGLLKDLDVDINKKPLWTTEPPDRVQWEWRRVKRSFGSKRRDKLVDDLRKWNESLRICLEKPDVPAEDEGQKVQALIRRFSPKRCNMIRGKMKSFYRALCSDLNCACTSPHEVALGIDWEAYETEKLDALQIAISYMGEQSPAAASVSWRKVQAMLANAPAEPEAEELTIPSSSSSMAVLENRKTTATTLISSVRCKMTPRLRSSFRFTPGLKAPASTSIAVTPVTALIPLANPDGPSKPAIPLEIQSLCVQISRQCNRWVLSGLVCDPDTENEAKSRFLLTHASQSNSVLKKPLALKSVLAGQQHGQRIHPHFALSAKQRYGIAVAMCWAVLHLSGSSWLQEKWEEQVDMLLENTMAGKEILARHPCVSCVLPGTQSSSESPDTTRNSEQTFPHLIRHKVIFSLGTLLIALCLNKPFSDLRETDDHDLSADSTSSTAADIGQSPASVLGDYQTAVSRLEEVHLQAGDSYGNAVERCIKFCFRGPEKTREFDLPGFRREFYDVVVAPVQATYLMMPGSSSW